MKNPKISICCPSYNSEKFIHHAVDSFVNQTYKNLEIILSDDASTDNTFNVIKDNFSDERIKLFKQETNLGPSLNSNFITYKATGEYICLCAGDDIMYPERVEKSLKFMQENPDCDMLYTFAEIVDSSGKPIEHKIEECFNQNKTPQEMLSYFFFKGNYICGNTTMIKRKVFEELKFNPCLLQLQDFDMWVKICLNGFKIKCLPERLTYYRVHGKNLSLNKNRRKEIVPIGKFEWTKILQNFSQSMNTKQVFEVFNKNLPSEKLIPFFIAQQCLLRNKKEHYIFALDTIYNEMLDDKKRELIYEHFGFTMKDFYKLSSKFELNFKLSRLQRLKKSIKKRIKKIKKLFS